MRNPLNTQRCSTPYWLLVHCVLVGAAFSLNSFRFKIAADFGLKTHHGYTIQAIIAFSVPLVFISFGLMADKMGHDKIPKMLYTNYLVLLLLICLILIIYGIYNGDSESKGDFKTTLGQKEFITPNNLSKFITKTQVIKIFA